MKNSLRIWICLTVLCLILSGASAVDAPEPAPVGMGIMEETAVDWPEAVLKEARAVWETACTEYGRTGLVRYFGELYADEGNGAVLPLLCAADGDYFLVVLVQQGETLSQVIFRIDESGESLQVFYDHTLTLDSRQALFCYSCSGSSLISAASLEDDLAAFAAAVPHTVEKRLFQGNENAESIAEMGVVPWEAFRNLYGDPEWMVRVDANYGLFHLQIRNPQAVQDQFGVVVPE